MSGSTQIDSDMGVHSQSSVGSNVEAPGDGCRTNDALAPEVCSGDLDRLFDGYDGAYKGVELDSGAPVGEELI
ncbi:hypothetical protein [Bifidobacterium myosotis]|uniref:Uncharacterized protein n=1 Tax=Bifidobacterium myosotis TaxID=1630166 RepID=A0A5M9ZKF4_9BIFI|nr:hypothetical protein [Bifidobacterium myosotis]KAA8828008.1 hypothetical protein EMO91_06040 [Bifidobacterium myosotis]